MPRKLLLHIGCHKTGTSAIQRGCVLNEAHLQSRGWQFAVAPGDVANWGNIFGFPKTAEGVRFRIRPDGYEKLDRVLSDLTGNIILSAEDLFFLEEEEITKLGAWLRQRFDAVTICAYLRRQDELALSQKAQGAKTVQSALLFGTGPGPLPELTPAVRSYLDFATRIETWAAAFDHPELSVHEYKRSGLKGGDIVKDFFAQIGLVGHSDGQDVNSSLGANETQLLLALRGAGLKQSDISRIRGSDWVARDREKFLPSRAAAQAFLAEFAASNQRLSEVLGAPFRFHDDFSKYPETEADTGYADYERENLLSVIGELSRITTDSAQMIYEVGHNIAKNRPRMALKLFTVAADMDPSRPLFLRARDRMRETVAKMDQAG